MTHVMDGGEQQCMNIDPFPWRPDGLKTLVFTTELCYSTAKMTRPATDAESELTMSQPTRPATVESQLKANSITIFSSSLNFNTHKKNFDTPLHIPPKVSPDENHPPTSGSIFKREKKQPCRSIW